MSELSGGPSLLPTKNILVLIPEIYDLGERVFADEIKLGS